MNNLVVYAFNTRYEIHNYELGQVPQLERELSIWDDSTHRLLPKYYYDDENHILCIPRGYDFYKLETMVGKPITYKKDSNPRKKASFTMVVPPKKEYADIQKESVRFLAGIEEYGRMSGESQLVLSLPPGIGKTYCAIAACSILQTKVMVIVGTDDLRKQWKEKIVEYTKLPNQSICAISGSKTLDMLEEAKETKIANYAFYITTHSTLRSYMKNRGFNALNQLFIKMGVGVKIVDEAHLQYLNILNIDYSTNVWKTFYLTATFNQSDKIEDILFQRAFNKIFKLYKTPSSRKHVIYIAGIFSTGANPIEREALKGTKGLDKCRYIDYEIDKGNILKVYAYFIDLLIRKKRIEGKTLVLSSKKSSCDLLKELTDDLLPAYASCVHYSGNKVDDFEPYGIIFATPKMLGTGNDIAGLRAIINLEPIRSPRNTLQIFGRLREYAPDMDTYYIELVDKSIPPVASMLRDRIKLLKDSCKNFMQVKF